MRQDPIGQAWGRYSLHKICDYLTRTTNGYVIVDKSKAIQSEDDERLFSVILHFDYGWHFNNEADTTVYFAVEDGQIYGGMFSIANNAPLNRRQIAKSFPGNPSLLYSYDQDRYTVICQKIIDA